MSMIKHQGLQRTEACGLATHFDLVPHACGWCATVPCLAQRGHWHLLGRLWSFAGANGMQNPGFSFRTWWASMHQGAGSPISDLLWCFVYVPEQGQWFHDWCCQRGLCQVHVLLFVTKWLLAHSTQCKVVQKDDLSNHMWWDGILCYILYILQIREIAGQSRPDAVNISVVFGCHAWIQGVLL